MLFDEGGDTPKSVIQLVRWIFRLPVLREEWAHVVKTLREGESKHALREAVLLDDVGKRCTALSRVTPRRQTTE